MNEEEKTKDHFTVEFVHYLGTAQKYIDVALQSHSGTTLKDTRETNLHRVQIFR